MNRRALAAVVLAAGLISASPAVVYAGQDTVIDQAGDWFATIGKSGMDKDAILMKRRADREAARAKKELEKQSKAAGKEMDKAGKDLKKAFGQ